MNLRNKASLCVTVRFRTEVLMHHNNKFFYLMRIQLPIKACSMIPVTLIEILYYRWKAAVLKLATEMN